MTFENYAIARRLLKRITELNVMIDQLQNKIIDGDCCLTSDDFLPIIGIMQQQITRLEIEFKHL
jgi:hypothetical protein